VSGRPDSGDGGIRLRARCNQRARRDRPGSTQPASAGDDHVSILAQAGQDVPHEVSRGIWIRWDPTVDDRHPAQRDSCSLERLLDTGNTKPLQLVIINKQDEIIDVPFRSQIPEIGHQISVVLTG
jgi:hypothetical protein